MKAGCSSFVACFVASRVIISASLATFEPCESHAMHREVAAMWLAYLIAVYRPKSNL